jgi:hypothetical protein
MLKTVWAVVREGKVELIEKAPLPEGALVLVTLLPQEDEGQFWMQASQVSLAEVWDNPQDDIYAQLLET